MENSLVPTENNAATVYQRLNDPMAAIKEMGQMFAASGMFGCSKVEQGQVLALACLIEGKSPFELMRNYHIIGGNLSMRSSAVLAEFQKRGGKCVWHSALNNVAEAKATFSINGSELKEAAYTIEDASREKLVGGNNPNWTTRPADMLRARLITKAIRMIAPGIVMGTMDETDVAAPASTEPLLPEKQQPENQREATLEELMEADKLEPKDAVAFLVERKRLEAGKTLSDLTPAARKKIAHNYTDFASKVREFANASDNN